MPQSHSRILRTCLLVAALATAISISLLMANTPSASHASPLTSLSVGGSKPTADESSSYAKPAVDGCWSLYGVSVPNSPNNLLHKIAALNSNDAWMVGSQAINGVQLNLILHWTGIDWHVIPSPSPDAAINYLTSIAAISANDIWAAGFSGTSVIVLHWNGIQWNALDVPVIHGVTVDLSVVSDDEIWALTRDGALHWNGTSWSIVTVPQFHYGTRSAIKAISSTDIWLAGTSTNNLTILYHSNGAIWTPVFSPQIGTVQGITRMTALAPDNVWAVGYYAAAENMPTSPLIEHWDGTQWTVVSTSYPDGSNVLNDVSFLSANDGWAVGTNNSYKPFLTHWDGSAWNNVTLPSAPFSYGGLEGVAAVSDADIWVVGDNPYNSKSSTLRYTLPCLSPTNTPTQTSTPGTPTATPTPTTLSLPGNWNSTNPPNPGPGSVDLKSISVISASDVWAVGAYTNGASGSIALHWDGSTWTNVPLPVFQCCPYTLVSVAAYAHNDVWALTLGNAIFHWDGSQWAESFISTSWWGIFGIAATSPDRAVAFSKVLLDFDTDYYVYTIYFWNGTSWDEHLGPSCFAGLICRLNSTAIKAFAPNNIWVGGFDLRGTPDQSNKSVLLHYDGNQLTKVEDPAIAATNGIVALTGTSDSDIWMSTENQFLHWNGYFAVSYPHSETINSMYAVSRSDVWAVGGNSILHWDGQEWGRVSNAPGQVSVASVGASNCGDIWTAGQSSNPDNHGMLLGHYSGPCVPLTPPPTPTSTPVTPRCSGERFTDVCQSDYFYEHVLDLNSLGILNGYTSSPPCDGPPNTPCFKPYNWTTRAQIAKVVSLAAGFDEDVTGQTFEDVTSGNTFYAFIERMASRSIINGYPCGGTGEPCDPENKPYFRPANRVSRGQLAKMAAVAFGFIEPVSGITFQDVTPGYTFYEYIERLAERNVISGYPCGNPEPCVPPDNLPYYRPGNIISRGQIAKIGNLARTQPSPTPTPVVSATETPTDTPTVITGPTGTPTYTPEISPTDTPTPDATSSPEATGTPSATETPQQTSTSTSTPTATP